MVVIVVVMVVVFLKTRCHSSAFTAEIDPQLLECSLQVINSWSVLRLLLVHLLNMPRLFPNCQLRIKSILRLLPLATNGYY